MVVTCKMQNRNATDKLNQQCSKLAEICGRITMLIYYIADLACISILHLQVTTNLQSSVQGFAESLQQDSSNQSEIVMIKLYCCGPDYCSIYPLLYYFFQIRHGLGSSVFKLCCKDSAKPCTYIAHRLDD